MPRTARCIPADSIVHVVNRGNDRRLLFGEPQDYEEFVGMIDATLGRRPVRLLAFGLMPNHWHLLLWPEVDVQVSQFLHYLTSLHAARIRSASGTRGNGHVYQARYRATIVAGDVHYVRAVRYIEANPLRARLVDRAEHWPWTSLPERLSTSRRIVDGPLPLPPPGEWATYVNLGSEDDWKSGPAKNGDSPPHIFGAGSMR